MRAGRPWNATRSEARRIQRQRLVVGELVEHGLVGGADVGRVARQRRPPERSLALAEQRPDVGRQETRGRRRPARTPRLGLPPQAVAVVEHLDAPVGVRDHRRAVPGHRVAGPGRCTRRDPPPQVIRLGGRQAGRHVASGSWAGVWSVTMSTATSRATSWGSTSALPSRPIDSGCRSARAASALARRRGRRWPRRGAGSPAGVASGRGRPRRRWPRRRSWSPPAAGHPHAPWPGMTVIVPARLPPKRRSAMAEKHS